MLQRIQTIWFLFAAACIFLTLKFATYSGTDPAVAPASYKEINGTYSMLLLFTTLVIGIVSLVTIFLYKNRKLQIRLSLLSILLEAVLIFLYYRVIQTFTAGTISLFAILHVGVIVFLILAARGISSDEKLIKDSNRLR